MYFAYDKFFSSTSALCSQQFEANVAECKELKEWKDLEDERDNLKGDLETETKKRKKASRERWGVVAGLGALGLIVLLKVGADRLRGKEMTEGTHKFSLLTKK